MAAAWARHRSRERQRGGAMVEVALLMGVFLLLVLGTFELARVMFLWNTLANVTRRAASTVAVSAPAADHSAALTAVAFGGVPLSAPAIDGTYFSVEYLNAGLDTVPAPSSSAANLRHCVEDPQGSTQCARFVRVRLCQPGGAGQCAPVPFEPIFAVGPFNGLALAFPNFETVVPVGALGYRPGMN